MNCCGGQTVKKEKKLPPTPASGGWHRPSHLRLPPGHKEQHHQHRSGGRATVSAWPADLQLQPQPPRRRPLRAPLLPLPPTSPTTTATTPGSPRTARPPLNRNIAVVIRPVIRVASAKSSVILGVSCVFVVFVRISWCADLPCSALQASTTLVPHHV